MPYLFSNFLLVLFMIIRFATKENIPNSTKKDMRETCQIKKIPSGIYSTKNNDKKFNVTIVYSNGALFPFAQN